MGHTTTEYFHITDTVLGGSGLLALGTDGLRSSEREPKVSSPSTAVLSSVTEGLEGCVMQSKIQPMAVVVKNICGGL